MATANTWQKSPRSCGSNVYHRSWPFFRGQGLWKGGKPDPSNQAIWLSGPVWLAAIFKSDIFQSIVTPPGVAGLCPLTPAPNSPKQVAPGPEEMRQLRRSRPTWGARIGPVHLENPAGGMCPTKQEVPRFLETRDGEWIMDGSWMDHGWIMDST